MCPRCGSNFTQVVARQLANGKEEKEARCFACGERVYTRDGETVIEAYRRQAQDRRHAP